MRQFPGYAHAPLVAPVASQRVQPVAGNVHVPRPQRNVQVRQDAPNTWSQGRGDSACITPPEECPQSLVLNNYTSIVTRYMPCFNLSERVIRLVRCGRVERCGSPLDVDRKQRPKQGVFDVTTHDPECNRDRGA